MKTTTFFARRRLSILAILFLLSTAVLTAQNKVVIKERLEISPTNNVRSQTMQNSGFPNITIDPIEPRFTDLSADCVISCDDPNADIPFVPRIGGTMGIALYPCGGSASGDTYDDILLVFGPDGHIRNMFPLSDLDSVFVLSGGTHYFWDPCYEKLVPVSVNSGETIRIWNPFSFDQAAYNMGMEYYGHADSANYWYAPYRILLSVKAWEPLRFRLLTKNGSLIKDINCYQGIGSDSNSFVISGNWTDFPSSWPPYDGGGVLVFRSGDYNAGSGYDPATEFPMVWLDIDSSAIGGAPTGVPYSGPITLPDSGFYQIILTGANPNVTGTLTYIDTASHIFVSDIQGSIGDTIHVGPYSAGTQLQVQLNGINPFTGQADYATWNMSFENWIDFGYPDVTVNIEYGAGPPDHLELWGTSSTVYYGDTVDVDVVPCGSDSLFSPIGIDENYAFSVSLEGETSRYGQLIYNGVGGDYFDGIPSVDRRGVGVKFAANGIEPDSSVDLTFFLASYYIGPVYEGPPTSIKTPPIKQTKTKILMKKSNNNPRMGDAISKNNIVALNRDSQNKIYNNAKSKKLQAISALRQLKKKKIGHPLAAGRNNTLTPKSYARNSISFKTSPTSVQAPRPFYLGNEWGWGEKKHTILLGETIYYQAKPDPNDKTGTKLIFKEMDETSGWEAGYPAAEFTVNAEEPKDKIGVYYESRDNNGIKLENNLIRLVGRYWTDTQTYEVRLKATSGERSGSILVVVKKPAMLGDTHNTANDYKGDSYNLDKFIVEQAGKEGVLPQYLKAMVSMETMGFYDPCYRYELWNDIADLQVKNRAGKFEYETNTTYSHYRILNASDKGTPAIPTDHSNVRDASKTRQPYPGYTTIWDYYWSHISFYSLAIYPTGEKEQHWENDRKEIREELYDNKTEDELSAVEKQILSDSTNTRFFRWAKSEYDGGMENMIAQTRLCASYGLLQLVYKGGIEYPQNNSNYRPEDINDHTIGFQYGVKHLVNKFNLPSVMNKHFTDPTWQAGLEEKYKQAVRLYNGAGDRAIKYANDVTAKVPLFKPKP